MANYPQELAQDALCQSYTGHMTGLWFLPIRPLRLNTNEWMNSIEALGFREIFQSENGAQGRINEKSTWLGNFDRQPHFTKQQPCFHNLQSPVLASVSCDKSSVQPRTRNLSTGLFAGRHEIDRSSLLPVTLQAQHTDV